MRYVRSPTLRSMVVHGSSGVAFAGAHLLLANALSTEQYALLTLVVAVATLGYHFAPIGLDAVVTRGRLAVGTPLLARVAVATTLVGAAVGGAAFAAYGLAAPTALLLAVATAAGGLVLVPAAAFQRDHRYGASLALLLAPNWLLLAGAAAVLVSGATSAALPLSVYAVGLAAAAVVGWRLVLREPARTAAAAFRIPWNEAMALAGVGAALMLLVQLERLVLPYVLPLADLALFGVLAAIAGSIFRVLQMGVAFSLLPRLRSAATTLERRLLLAHELRLAAAITLAGAAAIFWLTPLIERWLLAGKYHLPASLLAAAVFGGVAKIAHAFAKAAATALATPRELALVHGAGWISTALGIGSAVFGAQHFGLAGVVYGVGTGWLAWAVVSFALVAHHLRLPASVPART